MNLDIAIREENGVVKIKITTPDKPVVIETAKQNENVSPVTEAVKPDETLKAEAAALSAKITAMKREYERLKKAAYRAGKRLEKNLNDLGQGLTEAVPSQVPHVPEDCPQTVPYTVPGDNKGQPKTDAYNNYIINSVTNSDSTKTDDVTGQTPDGTNNCLPFVPEDAHRFIPLGKLPEMYREILTAWNNLPLPEKLNGLYTDVAQKLHKLLKEYGETAVQKAIRMVADSPFLLGKISNTRGWQHIYFGWLLNPANLKKILENRYRNRNRDGNPGNDCLTFPEYLPWNDEKVVAGCSAAILTAPVQEECSKYNAAMPCYLDPTYMMEGLDPITDHARSCLAREAALLGLTKISAA